MLRIVFILLMFSLVASPKGYKRYLNPYKAEQILGGIQFQPQITDQEWLSILGGRNQVRGLASNPSGDPSDDRYTVQSGDTLWGVSDKSFQNPKLWAKLWAVNPELGNPHNLEIGNNLRFYQQSEFDLLRSIPVIKLSPGSGLTDLENDIVFTTSLKDSYKPHFFISDDPDSEWNGEIAGSYEERRLLTVADVVYLEMNDLSKVEVGETYGIGRYMEDVSYDGDNLGSLMSYKGELRIIAKSKTLAIARITKARLPIEREDKIIDVAQPVEWTLVNEVPSGLELRVVRGELELLNRFSQTSLLLLNKGTEEGVQKGLKFRVYRDQDGYTGKRDTVEPYFKGEVQVIFASKHASIGFVLNNSLPIRTDDRLYPEEIFKKLPPDTFDNELSFEAFE